MSSKKKIGKTLHQSNSSKKVIIKLEEQASIGDYVYDDKGEKFGEIFDIIGPVDSPLASLKLDEEDSPPKSGSSVFIRPRTKRRGKRRGRRRR
ncbi:hypothetical protein GF319_10670 [Candidatus Bathyarchaeota archaeon]|nr:hypothetical protein [Candidatus Bathyarchaeota archaeon]